MRPHQAPSLWAELDGRVLMIGWNGKLLWVAHHGDWDIGVGNGRRAAGVVHHIQDAAGPTGGEEDREQIMEASGR